MFIRRIHCKQWKTTENSDKTNYDMFVSEAIVVT